jgi:hypothetical protein
MSLGELNKKVPINNRDQIGDSLFKNEIILILTHQKQTIFYGL